MRLIRISFVLFWSADNVIPVGQTESVPLPAGSRPQLTLCRRAALGEDQMDRHGGVVGVQVQSASQRAQVPLQVVPQEDHHVTRGGVDHASDNLTQLQSI